MFGWKMYFSDYMNEWLYGEEGYYKQFKAIGKSGDFYTAVSASSFFGASIANHFYTLLKEAKADRNGWLIEVGAHEGYLLCDMIQWLYTCDPTLVKTLKFGIVERQPEVRKAQLAYIEERFGDDIKITHFNDISDVQVDYAFVVANEIFDAFPCELLKDEKIAIVKENTIEWEEAPAQMLTWAKKHHLTQGEVAVGYEEFAKQMASGINHCDFVTFDYGEKYVRNDFSIRVYRKHETFPLFDEALVLGKSFKKDDITITDETITYIIDKYTQKEDGVRNLKRCLEIIYTKLNLFRLMKPESALFKDEKALKVEFPFIVTNEIVDKLIKYAKVL